MCFGYGIYVIVSVVLIVVFGRVFFLYVWYCFIYLLYNVLLNYYESCREKNLLSLFSGWEDWSLESLVGMFKVVRIVSGRIRIRILFCKIYFLIRIISV